MAQNLKLNLAKMKLLISPSPSPAVSPPVSSNASTIHQGAFKTSEQELGV